MANTKDRRSQALEFWVARQLTLNGWQIFTPYYDEGFDFVVFKDTTSHGPLLRPIQVRGRTPDKIDKLDDPDWGKDNLKLSQRHPELVVIMPFMTYDGITPVCTAYLPAVDHHVLNVNGNQGTLYTYPTKLVNGLPVPHRRFERYFDALGLALMDTPSAQLVRLLSEGTDSPLELSL